MNQYDNMMIYSQVCETTVQIENSSFGSEKARSQLSPSCVFILDEDKPHSNDVVWQPVQKINYECYSFAFRVLFFIWKHHSCASTIKAVCS